MYLILEYGLKLVLINNKNLSQIWFYSIAYHIVGLFV